MKVMPFILVGLLVSLASQGQVVRGSIQQGVAPNKVNIIYQPDHNSVGGEYVQALSVAVAIPTSMAGGLTPTIASAGPFSPLVFLPSVPFSYTMGTETIYSWIVSNNTSFAMSWSNGVPFVGATITFNGAPGAVKVKLVDLSNLESIGAGNGNSYFGIGVNVPPFDLTDYSGFFFQITGAAGGNNSIAGSFPNGDRFIETNLLISLPVNILNFSGYKNGSRNTLCWTVAGEVNNRGFDVQRSNDGINFNSIGFVNSQGGYSNSAVNYTFDDNNPAGKKQYYRLNQTDLDGNSKLSKIVMITADKPTVMRIGGLYPNPARTIVNIIIDAPQPDKLKLLVTDMAGKTIKQQEVNVGVGSNTAPVDIGNLASGSYLIKLKGQYPDSEATTAKFTKQ